MQQKEWFTLGVRLLGVWILFLGIEEVIAMVEARFGMISATHTTLAAYGFHAAANFAAGLYLLSGARILVDFAFGNRTAGEDGSRQSSP